MNREENKLKLFLCIFQYARCVMNAIDFRKESICDKND